MQPSGPTEVILNMNLGLSRSLRMTPVDLGSVLPDGETLAPIKWIRQTRLQFHRTLPVLLRAHLSALFCEKVLGDTESSQPVRQPVPQSGLTKSQLAEGKQRLCVCPGLLRLWKTNTTEWEANNTVYFLTF